MAADIGCVIGKMKKIKPNHYVTDLTRQKQSVQFPTQCRKLSNVHAMFLKSPYDNSY